MDLTKRYCRYNKIKVKLRRKGRKDINMAQRDDLSKYKLERFIEDVKKYADEVKKSRGEKRKSEKKKKQQPSCKKGIFENGCMSKPLKYPRPNAKTVEENLKHKARLNGDLSSLLQTGHTSAIPTSSPKLSVDTQEKDENLPDNSEFLQNHVKIVQKIIEVPNDESRISSRNDENNTNGDIFVTPRSEGVEQNTIDVEGCNPRKEDKNNAEPSVSNVNLLPDKICEEKLQMCEQTIATISSFFKKLCKTFPALDYDYCEEIRHRKREFEKGLQEDKESLILNAYEKENIRKQPGKNWLHCHIRGNSSIQQSNNNFNRERIQNEGAEGPSSQVSVGGNWFCSEEGKLSFLSPEKAHPLKLIHPETPIFRRQQISPLMYKALLAGTDKPQSPNYQNPNGKTLFKQNFRTSKVLSPLEGMFQEGPSMWNKISSPKRRNFVSPAMKVVTPIFKETRWFPLIHRNWANKLAHPYKNERTRFSFPRRDARLSLVSPVAHPFLCPSPETPSKSPSPVNSPGPCFHIPFVSSPLSILSTPNIIVNYQRQVPSNMLKNQEIFEPRIPYHFAYQPSLKLTSAADCESPLPIPISKGTYHKTRLDAASPTLSGFHQQQALKRKRKFFQYRKQKLRRLVLFSPHNF